MSTMKPTLRKSGKYMITVRVTHYIARDTVTACIAHDQGEMDPDPAALARLTRSDAERIVREQLGMYGSEISMVVIDYPDEQIEAVDERVIELFPDLDAR